METLYRKVIIDGKEENLPKEAGTYIAYRKDGYIFQDEYFAGRNSMTRWTDYIDWYLQSIEEQPKDKERIIRKNIFIAGYKGCENGWNIQKAMEWFDKTYSIEQIKKLNK